jgi:hypothetical protein
VDIWTEKQMVRQTDAWTEKQMVRQTDVWTEKTDGQAKKVSLAFVKVFFPIKVKLFLSKLINFPARDLNPIGN